MSLVIDAPAIERALREQAAKHGVTTEQYAVDILAAQLVESSPAEEMTVEHRVARLDALIASYAGRKRLPPEAFERSAFYATDRS